MNRRRVVLLSAICLAMGASSVSAQGFLKKLKNKGTQLVEKVAKEAAPEPVKKAVEKVNRTEAKVRGAKNKMARKKGKAEEAYEKSFQPGKKVITIKFCEGVGPKQWYGRVGGTSPMPPEDCPKQPAWSEKLPLTWHMTNARLIQEHKMMEKWMRDGKPSCEPVLVRREALMDEVDGRVRAVEGAVKRILANDPEEEDLLAESLESDMFKHAVNSDLSPLYSYFDEDVVAWLKSIDRTTKTLSVKVSEGNSSNDVLVQQGEMWFKVNTARRDATLECLDHDQSVGKDYVVPASITYAGRTFKVTNIGQTAFADLKIRSVKLSEGLQVIGRQAFTRTNLTSIEIPSTVTDIDYRAFAEMPQLKSVVVPSSVKKVGIAVFAYDPALVSATVNASVTEVGNAMFWGCKSLTKVTLPQGLTKLPSSMFEDCKALSHVDLPDGITVIEQNAFKNTSISQVPVPAALTSIESNAFESCQRLTSISLPARVTLDFMTFKDCKSLRKVVIGSQYKSDPSEIYNIFMGCPFVKPNMSKVPAAVSFNN